MRRTLAGLTIAGVAALVLPIVAAAPMMTAAAAEPPAEFGTDWDDPRTAVKPIEKPPTRSCEVALLDYEFKDFTPFQGTYTPPADCPGPWNKVVLRLDGAVKGRQYDRLGHLEIGGIPVFKTSTPEPSVDGIQWTVEKDITQYSALLTKPRSTWMLIGNVVNDTYTGILDVQVKLTFYTADRTHRPASTSDEVLPLANQHRENASLIGDLTVPRNSERLLADVYATGSGGGCEEFWYLTAPSSTGYSCPADAGPYREVQVLIDDRLAGIAAPFPHVYTGGWSNPFLWYVLPAPRAFDVRPLTYDLTPYLGVLNDGKPHRVAIRVEGVPANSSGWATPTGFRVWRDERSSVVQGKVIRESTTPVRNEVVVGDRSVSVDAGHRHSVTGVLRTSRGVQTITVDRKLGNRSAHTWGADENPDSLLSSWSDTGTITVNGKAIRVDASYDIDGRITVAADNRLTTTLSIADEEIRSGATRPSRMKDAYRGEASWILGVPRDQRHAVGVSTHRYRLLEPGDCYDHTISTSNGYITTDILTC